MSESEAADEAYKEAMSRAGRLLLRGPYSKSALVARLAAEGCDHAAAAKAVASLAESGFVNESRDIENLIGDGLRRGYGSLRIRIRLEQAGYSESAIDRAIQRELSPEKEVATAVAWLTHKFRSTGKRDLPRAFAALARRGFPEDVARDAAERVFGEEQ
ncbi:MAG: RecX family transcriptional regulator [Fimbriimonadia bacterium]|jgi:SOS response regulatory protein OraA/RecX